MTDFRALCADLVKQLEGWQCYASPDGPNAQVLDRARAALAQPEPEGPTDEEWEALKDRLLDRYKTVGYQGEVFIYDRDFDVALDDVRQELARWGK
jgi:hypothetical protein